MDMTRLSSKGQVVIPKRLRETHNWQSGLEFIVIDTGEGILLKPRYPFPPTTVKETAGCLAFGGEPKSLEEMDAAIQRAVRDEWHD